MNQDNTISRTLRLDRLTAGAAALAAFAVYLATMACTVSFWDSGEYIASAWIAGIPHPPCVPLFVLLGRFSAILLPFIPSVAQRVNLMCVFSGSASVFILARLVQRWCRRMGYDPWLYRPISVTAALLSAFSFTVWQNNNAAETYAVSQFFAVLTLWVFDLWIERNLAGKPGDRLILLVLYLLMLAVAVHLAALIVVPGISVYYLLRAIRGKTRLWASGRFLATALGLIILAFSVHLYMPLRAVQRPEINETDPSEWTAFRDALSRAQYGQMSILERKGPFLEQLAMYARYLSWQTGRPAAWENHFGDAGGGLHFALRVLVTAAAVWGAFVMWSRNRRVFLLTATIFLMASLFFVIYLNFKTGPIASPSGEVRDRDYFYADSFSFFAVFTAVGAASALSWLTRKRFVMWGLLALPVLSLGANYHECDRSRDMVAHDYGINLLESCSEGAVLITNGDNDTFPLWFAQSVLGVRRDVIVSNLSLMNTDWYVEQLLERDPGLLPFGEAGLVDSLRPVFIWGPHFFHVTESGYPLLSRGDELLLRSVFDQAWPWALTGEGPDIAVPWEGRGMQGSLGMQDLVLFGMLSRRQIHGRDIYLAGTVAQDSRVYLDPYLEMEGIAFRVTDRPSEWAVNPGRGWELFDSYRFTGLDDPSIYKDDQAVQLMRNYVSGYHRLAYYHLLHGEADMAREALERSRELFDAVPDEWVQILPSQSLIEARLADGLYGQAAASEVLYEAAGILTDASSRLRYPRLAQTGSLLTQLAGDFDREAQFYEFVDSTGSGTPGSRWMHIEVALGFGNNIEAWNSIEQWRADSPGDPALARAEEEMSAYMDSASMDGRLDLSTAAVATLLSLADNPEERNAENLLGTAIEKLADGRVMAAISPCSAAAGMITDPAQARLVEDFVERVLEDPDRAVRRAAWFVLERNRVQAPVLAWQCARLDEPAMCFVALSSDPDLEYAAEALLADPGGYVGSLPKPGSGSGAAAWVARLGG